MKKLLWTVLAVAAVWGIPRLSHPAVDIGKLKPVEVVRITGGREGILLETDQGDLGMGRTLTEAVENLHSSASGELFLDTADKLIFTGDLSGHWGELYLLFRPACQVCTAIGELDLKAAGAYLEIHPSELTLGQLRGGENGLQRLILEEGRGRFEPE